MRQTADAGEDELHSMFDIPDFFYRTATPHLLDRAALVALLDERTRYLRVGGRLVGLWSYRNLDSLNLNAADFSGFYEVYFRLRSDAPMAWWIEGMRGLCGSLAERNDVVRLTLRVPEFDRVGQDSASAMGFEREGVAAGTVFASGRLWGTAVYGRQRRADEDY